MTAFSPLEFEIFRHSLWEINEEIGLAAIHTSGSPVVYESNDFNTGILDSEGNGLVFGAYVSLHSTTLDAIVKSVIAAFEGDIHPGDVFITNDPWAGALHLMDFGSVSPYFVDGKILFWVGLVMHELDVGGPVPGSFAVGATDVFGEAPVYPPLRFARDGQIIRDVEAILLRNTRLPNVIQLDLRVRMAAAAIAETRLSDLVRKFGADRIREGQRQLVDHVSTMLRRRLSAIRPGTWRERVWIDHDGVTDVSAKIQVAITRRDERLIIDFTGTAPQTQGGVNCALPGLVGGVISAIFSMLCFDLSWCSAGVREVIEIVSEEGTVNNARFPSAVSMASVFGSWMTSRVVSGAMGKMLACCEELKLEAQAFWEPAYHGVIFAAHEPGGREVTAVPLDQEGGGGGARTDMDGIDVGSSLHNVMNAIPNVERNEELYPILQMWRRLRRDSGGPGKWRGGVGSEILYVPHGVEYPVLAIVFSSANDQPGAMGIHGGYPGSVQRHVVLRRSNLSDLLSSGFVPRSFEELGGDVVDVLPPMCQSPLGPGDVHWAFISGGGGYGDPLDRADGLVRRDLDDGLVSESVAEVVYGIGDDVDPAALRQDRVAHGTPPAVPLLGSVPIRRGTVDAIGWHGLVGEHIAICSMDGEDVCACFECGQLLSVMPKDPKLGAAWRRVPLEDASELNHYGRGDRFELREYFCPKCGCGIGVQVAPRDEEGVFTDMELAAGSRS